MVTEATRTQVILRAQNRCEYCQNQQQYLMAKLEIDHIWPTAKGGTDDESNLCAACKYCNLYKWSKTHGIDPATGEHVKLYNPRQQQWEHHFEWSESGTEILGLTPCGRVTVIELKLNNEIAVTVRYNWVQVGWHPPKIGE